MDLLSILGCCVWLLVGCSVHHPPVSLSPAAATVEESDANAVTEVRFRPAALDPGLVDAIDALGEDEAPIVPAMAKLNGNYSFDHQNALSALGVVVVTSIGPIITLDLPLRAAYDVAALPFMIKLEGSRPLYLEDDGEDVGEDIDLLLPAALPPSHTR